MSDDPGRTKVTRVGRHGSLPPQHVRVSLGLSCGCHVAPAADDVPSWEATGPGFVVICHRHDEYALVTRVTHRLVVDRDTAAAWLAASGAMDEDTAAGIVAEQFGGEAG